MTNTTFTASYHAKEVANVLQIGGSTLRKWCLQFEKQGHLFDRGVNNTRYFKAEDLMLLYKVKEQVQEHNRTLEDAVNLVLIGVEQEQQAMGVLDSFKEEQQVEEPLVTVEDIEEIKVRLDEQAEFNKALLNELQKQKKALPDPQQQRLERFNTMVAERRVTSQLEQEALVLWDNKSMEERFIKVGWFRKVEDTAKRDHFVKQYVNERYEQRLALEFGLGGDNYGQD